MKLQPGVAMPIFLHVFGLPPKRLLIGLIGSWSAAGLRITNGRCGKAPHMCRSYHICWKTQTIGYRQKNSFLPWRQHFRMIHASAIMLYRRVWPRHYMYYWIRACFTAPQTISTVRPRNCTKYWGRSCNETRTRCAWSLFTSGHLRDSLGPELLP